ncbi:hypothetical protein CUD01_25240 [Cellulomonas uda]|uniref:Uncharacterized protein n=1 Tax=Cellulomonas uda TaxID=1714 RepID=A0A4Y3KGM1_CELUD|nr:hypothetical protein CUD01_25240 [Cellulomonas uda]
MLLAAGGLITQSPPKRRRARIAAGDTVRLSIPGDAIQLETFLAREVGHLVDNGYVWVDFYTLRPGG